MSKRYKMLIEMSGSPRRELSVYKDTSDESLEIDIDGYFNSSDPGQGYIVLTKEQATKLKEALEIGGY